MFKDYPPEARGIAVKQLTLLTQLPIGFVPLLLRELITYDWKFPAERNELDHQFQYLNSLSAKQLDAELGSFRNLRLSPELERTDWVNRPAEFSEKLTAHLWATHQIDAFRQASIDYVHKLNEAKPSTPPAIPRLTIAVIGRDANPDRYTPFRKLRPYGTSFRKIDPSDGLQIILETVRKRAATHRAPFAHWYIDGAATGVAADGLACVSYHSLDPVRNALITRMRAVMQPGGGGPELLRTMLAQMRPSDLGLAGTGTQAVLDRFQIGILTEGSGTQLFSTTFVQWSGREILRRAQPLTLLLRFAPRQHEQSMRELLAGVAHSSLPDPDGSLIDADMGAYYTWINQQRLPGREQATFLAWFENRNEAIAIGSVFARGKEDLSSLNLRQLLNRTG